MSATCGHVSCARREHQVAVLIKAALDSANELDALQAQIHKTGSAVVDDDEHARLRGIVERNYDACEQLGEKIGVSDEPKEKQPCKHVVIVADVCAKCGAEVPA